jgi:hypothetical protein
VTYQTQGDYLTPTDKIKLNPGPTIVDDIRAGSFSRPAIKNDSDDPQQAALIGARIGRRNTGQLSTPRLKPAPLSRNS